MSGDVDVRVVYSRDQRARAEMQHWEQVAASVPRWRLRHRRKAESLAEEARERAVSAGVDWNLVPRPPQGLRAPNRSRPGEGIDRASADWRPSPPPQPSGSGQSALSGLHLTMQLATAPVPSAHAAERAHGEQRDNAPARDPVPRTTEPGGSQEPSPTAVESGDGTPTTPVMPAAAGGATPPPPTPGAPPSVAALAATPAAAAPPITSVATAAVPAASTSGGGVGLAYGSADVGSLTAVSAMDWINTGPQPVYQDPGGAGFLQAPDGGLWYQDAAGVSYALGPDGAYYALGEDGYLYGQLPDGSYFTWAEDGTQLLADEQGLLWAYTDTGQPMVLGDDGLYYPPDAWPTSAAPPEEPAVPVEPTTDLPAEQPPLDPDAEFAGYADPASVAETGPTPGLADLAPDPLWPAETGDPTAPFDDGETSEPLAFGDPFSEPGALLPGSPDDGTAFEPSFAEPLPPLEDPILDEHVIADDTGYPPDDEDVSSDEPPAEPPSSGWMDGTLDI
jgi:hypothetical protein